MKIRARLNDVYVPEWNGNKDVPADEKISVEFIWLPYGWEGDLPEPRMTKKGELSGHGFKSMARHICSRYVTKVNNFELIEKKILTGEDLVSVPTMTLENGAKIWDLVEEIAIHILAGQDISSKKKTSE